MEDSASGISRKLSRKGKIMKRTLILGLALFLSGAAFAATGTGEDVVVALKDGQTETALSLLGDSPELVKADLGLEAGMTLLHYAVYFGNETIVDHALKNGADLNLKDSRGLSPVWFSVSGGRPEMLRKLIALKADLAITNPAGDNMLFRAAAGGNEEIVRILLENGFRAADKNAAGKSPLFYAAQAGALDVFKLLESKGADLKAVTETGATVLHEAARSPQTDVLEYLLTKGMDVNAPTTNGMTPLHSAIGWRNTAGVSALIEKGADVNASAREGLTPLLMALGVGSPEIATLLAENGADVNAVGEGGQTPFLFAVMKGEPELIRFFLGKKAKLELTDPLTGKTALHEAALRGYTPIVEDLLKAGAKKNARDKEGRTALSYAKKYGHKDTADLLARNGVKNVAWETNFDDDAYLKKDLKDGQAYVWYLNHSGYAVKTKSAILVFDYWDPAPSPARSLLANGHIDPEELKGWPVYVFASHGHDDHFDRRILEWKKTIPDIHYIFGFEDDAEVGAVYAAPRTQRTLGPMTITTIQSSDEGVGFAVQIDGLTLFHAGDHSNNSLEKEGNTFFPEIDFLAERGIRADAAFFLNMFGCGSTHPEAFRQGIFYAADKLGIETVFPMHGMYREWVYADLKEAAAKNGVKVDVQAAVNRGDRFFITARQ